MQRTYEVMIIVRPDIADEDLDKLISTLESQVVAAGGTVKSIERMGKRIILPIGPSDTGGTQLMPRTKVVPMDPTLVHAPVCATCVMKTMCNGVSARYLEHYGSAGLAPILA